MDAFLDPAPGGPTARFDRRELHDLLCNLSGELCRPLASLRMGFDLMLGARPSPFSVMQEGHVAAMRGLCDDLLRLTRSYLEYAEIIRASRPTNLGAYSLGALVAEADRTFAASAREKGLDWSVEVVGDDSRVTTDASRCQQILAALISNAVKFTHAGGRVRIVGTAGADFWSVAVIDDGPGMSPDEALRVFEPFYRLTRDEHSVEGSGLGLSIAQELAAQLGGRIVLESREGKGVSAVANFPAHPTLRVVDLAADSPVGDRH